MMRLRVGERLLLGVAILSVLGAAAILATRGRSAGGQSPVATSCRLADGSTLCVVGMHWGRTHVYHPRVPWSRQLLHRLWPGRYPLPSGSFTVSSREPLLGIWLAREGIPARNPVVLHSAVAQDAHGCLFPATEFLDDQVSAHRPGLGTQVFIGLDRFPRHKEAFRLAFQGSGGRTAGELTVSPGQVPAPPQHAWHPASLPITRGAGDLSVTLAEVHTWLPRPDLGRSVMDLSFRFCRGGRPTDAWEPALDRMTLSDPRGNTERVMHLATMPDGRVLLSSLCPNEPAWRLRVPVFPAATAPAPPDERLQILNVPAPRPGQAIPLRQDGIVQGAVLRFLAVAGPGIYEYRAGAPATAKVLPGETRRLMGSGSISVMPAASAGTWTVTAGMAHVAVDARNVPADCRLTLRVTDERGRVCRVWGPYGGGEGTLCLGVHVAPDAGRLHLELAVRRGRRVEFVFVPPPPDRLP